MKNMTKEELRAEFAKAWDSDRMIDYCTNKTAAVAILPAGEIITIDKQSIETHFCFGESGYDYDDAVKAAAHALTSEEHFKRENMKGFAGWIDTLTDARDINSNYRVAIRRPMYTGQTEDCRLGYIRVMRLTEVLEGCGGSAYLEELPGKEITVWNETYRIATDEELEILLAAYTEAARKHEKKVDAYLKRYGLSKVHSWTYWRDA